SDSSGLKTKFTACDDYVTPKEEINLRSIPSVTDETAVVIATVPNGEVLHRTGINNEYGWSRIDYNGQTVYCISSYLTGAQ
ncbi:MAG: glycoside hydrolase family 25, partial [Lachnospiraceae bacterium]|nr:glycoside hydrolase family 25 [Lachnospiraceae bacterium]